MSAVSPPDKQAVGLLPFACLYQVSHDTVRLERQLSCGADDDARRAIAMRPLHFVERLQGNEKVTTRSPFRETEVGLRLLQHCYNIKIAKLTKLWVRTPTLLLYVRESTSKTIYSKEHFHTRIIHPESSDCDGDRIR